MDDETKRSLVGSICAHLKYVALTTGWPNIRNDASRRDCEMAVGANLILLLANELGLEVEP